MSIRKSIVILALSGVAAVAGITYGLSGSTSYRGVRAGFADENYLKSRDCRTCHEAADALGGSSASPPPDPLWAGPFLLEAFSDRYPIVRFFAANGLSRPGVPWRLDKPDYLGPLALRDDLLSKWREAMTICRADARAQALDFSKSLRAANREVDLEVGE